MPGPCGGPGADEGGPAWHVYIAECADGSLYTGIARDVAARLNQHNEGNGARYTRSRLPVRLVYVEKAADRAVALRREHAIKQMKAPAKRMLVLGVSGS